MPETQQTNGTTAIQQPRTVDPARALMSYLDARKENIKKVLPKHLTPERVLKIAIAAASRAPLLLQCSPESVYLSVHQAAQLGLEPGGPLGGAYLVPYWNKKANNGRGGYECQLIVGYRGLIDLARRSGQIKSIEAHVVRDGDKFDVRFGMDPKLDHAPNLDAKGNEPIRFAYMVATLADGAKQVEVMTIAEIEAIRKRSKAGENGPWVTDYAEMCRKTVVRRGSKYLPMSVELADALDHEAQTDTYDVVPNLPAVAHVDEPPPHDPVTGEVREPAALPEDTGTATPALEKAPTQAETVKAELRTPTAPPVQGELHAPEPAAEKRASAPAGDDASFQLIRDAIDDAESPEDIAAAKAKIEAAKPRLSDYHFGKLNQALYKAEKRIHRQ